MDKAAILKMMTDHLESKSIAKPRMHKIAPELFAVGMDAFLDDLADRAVAHALERQKEEGAGAGGEVTRVDIEAIAPGLLLDYR
jgi:hypothetical protein